MNERYLLDTNAVSAALRGVPSVIARIATAADLFLSSIVLGELYYGAYNSERVATNLALYEVIADNNLILACDAGTASVYGHIAADLKRRGQPIPTNDMWIAALAIQHDLTPLTRAAHCDRVAGLAVVPW